MKLTASDLIFSGLATYQEAAPVMKEVKRKKVKVAIGRKLMRRFLEEHIRDDLRHTAAFIDSIDMHLDSLKLDGYSCLYSFETKTGEFIWFNHRLRIANHKLALKQAKKGHIIVGRKK